MTTLTNRARLRAVPSAPRRGIGIVRVSKEGGRGDQLVSPEIQRHAIEEYAGRQGIDIVDWVEAIDESGSRRRSAWWPRLDATIERVEAGEVDVILGWEFSRHARNRLRWNVALDRVESAGGSIESATEPVDATTASGRFQRGVLAEMHAYKAEAIGESWRDVQARRRRHGLPHSGSPRLGYTYDPQTKTYLPDESDGDHLGTADVVRELHRRYIAGEGLIPLARWLATIGVESPRSKKPWSFAGVGGFLENGFAAGFLRVHDPDCVARHAAGAQCKNYVYVDGAHKPIIDEATWKATLEVRGQRRAESPRLLAAATPLSGVVRCGTCGARMPRQRHRGRNSRDRLSCTNRDCGRQASALYDVVEAAVLDWLPTVRERVEAAAVAAAESPTNTAAAEVQRRRLRDKALDAERALANLTVDLGRRLIPASAYEAARDALLDEKRDAERELARLERQEEADQRHATTAGHLLESWGALPPTDAARMLREIAVVRVRRRDVARGCDIEVHGAWEEEAQPFAP
jgi:DNA invertase Pin-like site-specific DNA recombinase